MFKMKLKITPISETQQMLEFNITLPSGANASIAPTSSIAINQRWAVVQNVSTTSTASYLQVTKLDIVYNIQYTDMCGNQKVKTETCSTIMASPATSETPTTLTVSPIKYVDIIIPNGVGIVTQQVLNELPTSISVKGNCAYSVFVIQQPSTTQTTQLAVDSPVTTSKSK